MKPIHYFFAGWMVLGILVAMILAIKGLPRLGMPLGLGCFSILLWICGWRPNQW